MDQHCLVNPIEQEIFIRAAIEDGSGQKAVRRYNKKQINSTPGNVARYSDLMNGPNKLVQLYLKNALAAALGDLKSEKVI